MNCMYVCTCIYVHIYVCMYVYMFACIYVCMYVCISFYVPVCIVCVFWNYLISAKTNTGMSIMHITWYKMPKIHNMYVCI